MTNFLSNKQKDLLQAMFAKDQTLVNSLAANMLLAEVLEVLAVADGVVKGNDQLIEEISLPENIF